MLRFFPGKCIIAVWYEKKGVILSKENKSILKGIGVSRAKAEIYMTLERIGLSKAEAEIYLTLVREPGITGYKVSQSTGKPVPNTYKNLENLAARGAIMLDDNGKSRLYSVVPIKEFIKQLVYSLETTGETLENRFRALNSALPEEGVYRVMNVLQVYSRAVEMIQSAKKILFIEADALPMNRLKESIEAAAARGVKVLLHSSDGDLVFKGCDIIHSCSQDWPGEWLVVLIDGAEYLICAMASGEEYVYQALWSRNPYLTPSIFQGCLNKAILCRIKQMFDGDKSKKDIKVELDYLWDTYCGKNPGSEVLMKSL